MQQHTCAGPMHTLQCKVSSSEQALKDSCSGIVSMSWGLSTDTINDSSQCHYQYRPAQYFCWKHSRQWEFFFQTSRFSLTRFVFWWLRIPPWVVECFFLSCLSSQCLLSSHCGIFPFWNALPFPFPKMDPILT